jgi:hypothetical protein
MAVWGGGALLCTSFHLSGEVLQAMRAGWYTFHCPISVFFSFSTFPCFAASWTGVDKNIRTICAEHGQKLAILGKNINFNWFLNF